MIVRDPRRANPRLAAMRWRAARAQAQRQSAPVIDLIMLLAVVLFLVIFVGDW